MNAKTLIDNLKDAPVAADVFVRLADVWLKVDSVTIRRESGAAAVEIVASSANWPLFREGK